jgi:hypothetical protein
MGLVRTSETSVYSNENTRRYIPEGSNFYLNFTSVYETFSLDWLKGIISYGALVCRAVTVRNEGEYEIKAFVIDFSFL